MIPTTLKKIIAGETLTEEETANIFDEILSGNWTPVQIAGLITALATRGETYQELAGAARAMRAKASRIQVMGSPVVDIVGTGGDGLDTFNVSTVSALVVAGAGVVVAKHGNRSVSSKCGSADVLEACGVNLDVAPEVVEETIATIGIGFMFAPKFHGAMRHAVGPRKELGVRTIFNMLGPLTNPAGAGCMVVGVFAPELTEMFAEALRTMGTPRALVVHGEDGMDEITMTGSTRVTELNDGVLKTYDIQPETYFGEAALEQELAGGVIQENAKILRGILSAEISGAKRHIVLLNAGAALYAADKTDTLAGGIEMAAESIDSGRALEKLEELAAYTQENA
jgi:anthranilate phosphoribosyltransferase